MNEAPHEHVYIKMLLGLIRPKYRCYKDYMLYVGADLPDKAYFLIEGDHPSEYSCV